MRSALVLSLLFTGCVGSAGQADISVVLSFHGEGVSEPPGDVLGSIRSTTERGETVTPFRQDLGEQSAFGVSLVATSFWRANSRLTLSCDPDAGPVTLTATLEAFAPSDGSAAIPITGEQTATVACRPDWTGAVQLDFQVADPTRYGQVTFDVTLADPPPGADGASLAVGGTSAVGIGPSLGATRPLLYSGLDLLPDGDVLSGAITIDCLAAWPFEYTVDVGRLTVAGRSEADVWAAWPPPERVWGDLTCLPGQVQTVAITLTARE